MNSSMPRKTPPRRGSEPPVRQSSAGQPIRLVLLDDRAEFLEAIGQIAERSRGRFAVHAFHTGSQTDFPAFLLELQAQEGQLDAVLIDLIIADTLEGQSGLGYLTALRAKPELLGLPVVIASSAGEGEVAWNEEDHGRIQPGLATIDGADDYLLGKRASIDFLEECRRRLPFWRVQAHNRLWQTLIHRIHNPDVTGVWEDVSRQLTRQAFAFGEQHLRVEHAILRLRKPTPGATLDTFECLNAAWAEQYRAALLDQVPILRTILDEKGKAVLEEHLTEAQAGKLKNYILGKRMVGVALSLPGEEPFGVLTLLRDNKRQPFTRLDAFWVERLGASLSAVLGQSRHVQQLKDRQASALIFARQLDAAHDEISLCRELAEFLQREIHGSAHAQSKVTVRLIAAGEPVLKRWGSAGHYQDHGDIPLDDAQGQDNARSVYASVVNACSPLNIDDVTKPEWREKYTKHEPGYPVHSELCIPLRVGTDGDIHALGAVNLEHADVAYYREHDRDFVETIAAYASQTLRQLRQQKLTTALLDWAAEAHRLTAEQLWDKVASALFTYVGYGALLHLAPSDGWPSDKGEAPWRVERVHIPVRRQGVSTEQAQWQEHLNQSWQRTLIHRSLTTLERERTLLFEGDPDKFIQSGHLLGGARQRGNALLPLVTREGRFIGVLVLLWFHHPALDEEDQALLATFGRYCAELVAHQADWTSQTNQLRLAEQRSVLANAARQFEHILSNRLGGIGNRLNALKSDLELAVPDAGRRDELLAQIETMQSRLDQLDQRSRRAVLYMRVPVMQAAVVEQVWARVAADMVDKARKHGIQVDCPASQSACRADPEILYNILFILLDNALDALLGTTGGRVWLELNRKTESLEITVADNGPGVPPAIRKRLFVEEGATSKGSLGVGLFLARQRARAMEGDLNEHGNGQGARFVLSLPVEEDHA